MIDLKGNREGRLVCLLGLILTFGTIACYSPVWRFDFVNVDDGVYVYNSRMVQQGLSWPGVAWAFKSVDGGNWNPLVWLSHMADCQLYGLKPGGHHLTNLLLHAANVLVLFLVFKSMTGAVWRSAFAAAIFAWHPTHVESVAWISERKDVLSTLFFLAAVWAYARFAKTAANSGSCRKRFYVLASLFFVLGLMSKPMLVTLPLVFLLLDYWPLQRVESVRRLVIEKVPFLILSLSASVAAVWAQHSAGAVASAVPLSLRAENAAVSYVKYIEKLFLPVDLSFFYPLQHTISAWRTAGSIAVLAVVSLLVLRAMEKRRYLATGWFWFLGTLVPVIGFVQVGLQALADRYTYIPYIGLSVMAGWGLADLARAWPRSRAALRVAATLALVCCLGATSSQVKYWRNNTTLYEHALKIDPGNYIAHSNLGNTLMESGRYADAAMHYQEVVRLMPDTSTGYNNLGWAYVSEDKLDEGMELFQKAISLDYRLEPAHYNLGNAFLLKGKMTDAATELKIALRLKPDDMRVKERLAEALVKSGKPVEAIPYWKAVVGGNPNDAHARVTLGMTLQAGGQPEQALSCYKTAVRLAPDTPQCLNALAWTYATCPKPELRNGSEAVRLATRACQITKQQNTEMLDTLSAAYAEAGRFEEAVKTAEAVRALALAAHDTNMTDLTRRRLELYRTSRAVRDGQ